MAERLRERFGGTLPVQCIVNEYRPGQSIGCTPTTRTSAPSSRRSRSPTTGRCASGRAPRVRTPPAPCRATRSSCSPGAPCWCSKEMPAIGGCTVSTDRRPGPLHTPLRHLPHPRPVARPPHSRPLFRAHPFGTALSCCASSRAALVSTLPGFDRLRAGGKPPEPPGALALRARGGVRLSSPAIPILARVLASSTLRVRSRGPSGDETCARVARMDCRHSPGAHSENAS